MLERVGTWPGYGRGPAADVCVVGPYAYVAIDEGGLLILDIKDPANPRRVGEYPAAGRTMQVQVVGSRAYLGTSFHRGGGCEEEGQRGRLLILDVEDPTRPVLLGSFVTSTGIQAIHIAQNLAFIGCHEDGENHQYSFSIVDVTHPEHPVELSVHHTFTSDAIGVAGSQAFVGHWGDRGGVSVLNIRVPEFPITTSSPSVDFRSRVTGIQATEDRVYVVGRSVSGSDGQPQGYVEIYATKQGSDPQLLGKLPLDHPPLGMRVVDHHAYLTMQSHGLVAIDVGDPAHPALVGACDTPGTAMRVDVHDGFAYVATYAGGIHVIDVRDPGRMAKVGSFDTGLTARDLHVSGNRAYLLSSDDRYRLHDQIDSVGRSRVEILDVTLPTRPILLGVHDIPRRVLAMDRVGDLAYLVWNRAEDSGLEIIDFRDPNQPARVSDSPIGNLYPAAAIVVNGRYAYITLASGNGFVVLDVGDPAHVVHSTVPVTQPDRIQGRLGIRGDCLYANVDHRLDVWTTAEAGNPALVGSRDTGVQSTDPGGVVVADEFAYVLKGFRGFTIMDIRVPRAPVLVVSFNTRGQVHDLRVEGRYAFVAEGWEGLRVFEVNLPYSPSPITRFPSRGQARSVRLSDDHIYVAEGGTGLSILGFRADPVTILDGPGDMRIVQGATATLKVLAYGAGSLSYQWYGGETVEFSHPIPGATHESFTTPALTEPAAYWVRVTNGSEIQDSRIARVDLAPAVSVELVGQWPDYRRLGVMAEDVAVSGPYAFLADASEGLKILDIRHPAQPILAGSFVSRPRRIVARGTQILLAGDTFQFLDASDPADVKLLMSLEKHYGTVAMAEDYAYFADRELIAIDVRDPESPKLVDGFALSSQWGTARIAHFGHYGCLAQNWDGLQIYDFGVPSRPRRMATYYADWPVTDVALSDEIACVLAVGGGASWDDNSSGLEVIDLRDVRQPTQIAHLSLSAANRLAFMGNYVCVTGDGLEVIDLNDPRQPVSAGRHRTGMPTYGLQVVGDLAFVAAGEYGLAIYRVTPQWRLNPPVRLGNSLHLSWLGLPGLRLQTSPTLLPPDWQDVPGSEGASSAQRSATDRCGFYRLVRH